mgnify:CR=1 FL=1
MTPAGQEMVCFLQEMARDTRIRLVECEHMDDLEAEGGPADVPDDARPDAGTEDRAGSWDCASLT